eukprot:4315235-Karenia_brevis.AAC.1
MAYGARRPRRHIVADGARRPMCYWGQGAPDPGPEAHATFCGPWYPEAHEALWPMGPKGPCVIVTWVPGGPWSMGPGSP